MGLKIKQKKTLKTCNNDRVAWLRDWKPSPQSLVAVVRLISNSDNQRYTVLFPCINALKFYNSTIILLCYNGLLSCFGRVIQGYYKWFTRFQNSFIALPPFSKGTEVMLPTGAYITNLVSLRFVSYINRVCTCNTLDNIAFWKWMNHL
jgi:hypothetical protein